MRIQNKKLVLADGRSFLGYGFGADVDAIGELVFDTSMVGYQEALTDPAYLGQAVVFTYPLIGNYGLSDEDYESKSLSVGMVIVREYNDQPSNFRYTKTLGEVLEECQTPGIEGVDTRAITEIIRNEGAQKVLLTDVDTPPEEAERLLREWQRPEDGSAKVSCKKPWLSRTAKPEYNVVVLDLGVKYSLIRALNRAGCNVTIVPFDTSSREILALSPDGVVISSGPSAPEDLPQVVETIRELRGKVPLWGISLGHLLIGNAYGAASYKMRVGHRGAFPVKDLKSGMIRMASENHGYGIREEKILETALKATHRNVLLGDIEGMVHLEDAVMTTQFYPEGNPGPNDYRELFHEFIKLINVKKNA